MKTTENNIPTSARLSRVTDVLISSGDKYAGLVLNPNVSVPKRDGTTMKYTSAVISIAQSIAGMGKDACTCTKVMILDCADEYLGKGESTSVATTDATLVDAPVDTPVPCPCVSRKETAQPNADVKLSAPASAKSMSSDFAIYSLLSMALNLAGKYDTCAGSEDRKNTLSSITESYRVLLP